MLKIRLVILVWGLIFSFLVSAQTKLQQGSWKLELLRADGNAIPFRLDIRLEKKKEVGYIVNGSEEIRIDKMSYTADSVKFEMPFFESSFSARRVSATNWEGVWKKSSSTNWFTMPFKAVYDSERSGDMLMNPKNTITGKWSLTFERKDKSTRPAIGQWVQKGNKLSGTIITPTGDYRYLNGTVKGDSMELSTFDGSHAFRLTAKIDNDNRLSKGFFYNGATTLEPWVAIRNDTATLPNLAAMYLKDGEERLNFRFKDLNDQPVSITDAKFKNKVVIIQIMGSWCPNCMDETAFLSEYYQKNKHRGIEVIALAYEYTTDRERSKKSIEMIKKRFDVQYTILNTGVTVSDSLRTEKTLPQLTPIKSFPSTIFINREGRVASIHGGFEGPGTGSRYTVLKKDFEETINRLLKQ
ncbi:MAG: hypothetical protein RLZZ28_487 [Bacteroidota bacterium]|jgi:thiol-disulfide isomerase/thioredoxin